MVSSVSRESCRCRASVASVLPPPSEAPSLLPFQEFSVPAHQADTADKTEISPDAAAPSPVDSIGTDTPLRILIAPSGFKESLGPDAVANAIEKGVRRALKDHQVSLYKLPLDDGGEGFCRSVVAAKGGYLRSAIVKGPTGLKIRSHLGFIGHNHKTAVIEMAAAAGLRLVPKDRRDPTITSTYGVGQLMRIALGNGCNKIIVGCGDSGTSDGGAGMLQALGARLLDKDGIDLPLAHGGGCLAQLDDICWCHAHPRLRNSAGKKSSTL